MILIDCFHEIIQNKSQNLYNIYQGRRNEFELTGAKNRRLANGRQGEEKFWSEKSYFYYKVLRLRIKVHKSSEKIQN